jgi:hypothetical protein
MLTNTESQKVDAQGTTTSFLSSPYYGSKTVTSHFDHEYPNRAENTVFTRYDGVRFTEPPLDAWGCNTGVNCYDGHEGIDFAGFVGTDNYGPVLAAASGYVTRAEWYDSNNRLSAYGLVVEIMHSNGYVTRYGHLSSIVVEEGQFVVVGSIIGTSGSTGNSGNVHLHFGVMNSNNQTVDPFGWSGNYTDPWRQSSGAISSWLWAGGQFVGSPAPFPQYVDEIILDNSGGINEFIKACESGNYWWDVTGVGQLGNMAYTFVGLYGDCYALWREDVPSSGFYDIDVFVPRDHTTSWQANFRIRETTEFVLVPTIVDQQGTSDRWLSLGTHYLVDWNAPNPYIIVSINDYTGESDYSRKIGVDAVRLKQRVPPVYLPIIIK